MTSPMSMCFVLGRICHGTLMMCINGTYLYWDDVTFHMSISMFLLHDAHVEEGKLQDLLLLWLLLGELACPSYMEEMEGGSKRTYFGGYYWENMV